MSNLKLLALAIAGSLLIAIAAVYGLPALLISIMINN